MTKRRTCLENGAIGFHGTLNDAALRAIDSPELKRRLEAEGAKPE